MAIPEGTPPAPSQVATEFEANPWLRLHCLVPTSMWRKARIILGALPLVERLTFGSGLRYTDPASSLGLSKAKALTCRVARPIKTARVGSTESTA